MLIYTYMVFPGVRNAGKKITHSNYNQSVKNKENIFFKLIHYLIKMQIILK